MTTYPNHPTHRSDPTHPSNGALSFLTTAPVTGRVLGDTLPGIVELFELAEGLGYDRGWLCQDGEEPSVASVVTLLSAISQRTGALGLGAGLLGAGRQSATELSSALLMLDALAGGRVHAGFSGHEPDRSWVLQVRRQLTDRVPATGARIPLGRRVWYAADSPTSARWVAGLGLNLLSADVAADPAADELAQAQRAVLGAYQEAADASGRTAVTRLLLPTDSAGPAARSAYAARATQAPARTAAGTFAGSSCQILERLAVDRAVCAAGELVVLLPVDLEVGEQAQILHDVAAYIAPELGFGVGADVGPCDEEDDRRSPSPDATEPALGSQAA